jgi:hypothetical protein
MRLRTEMAAELESEAEKRNDGQESLEPRSRVWGYKIKKRKQERKETER